MAQPVSQPAVYANGLRCETSFNIKDARIHLVQFIVASFCSCSQILLVQPPSAVISQLTYAITTESAALFSYGPIRKYLLTYILTEHEVEVDGILLTL
jgi:hypothetical protein